MIRVIAQKFIKEENLEKSAPLFIEMVNETRKEKGCIRYDLFTDSNDKTNFIFLEEWETKESLDAHMASAHFTRIIPQLDELTEKAGAVNIINPFKVD